MSKVASLYMILAWILGETELMIHVPTMLSQRIQAWKVEGVFTKEDRVREPSMNPNLFFVIQAFLMEQAQAR